MRMMQRFTRWLRREPVLPAPDRSCRRETEIADTMARYSSRIGRQS